MNFIKNTAAGITADPKKADPDFEELRKQFKVYSDAVDKIKSDAKKLQDETRSWVKVYKNLGEDVDVFFKVDNKDGQRFNDYVQTLDGAVNDLQSGIGEVVAGTEILININSGIWKRCDQRDSVTKDYIVAEGNKEKDAKNKQKYEEAKQKFEEVNSKLKNDIKETLTAGHPKFRGHFEKLIESQKRAFKAMAEAAERAD